MKKIPFDFSALQEIFRRPEPLNRFAREGMAEVKYLLRGGDPYRCDPSCYRCCTGSILMSYTEFTYVTLYLQETWPERHIEELMRNRVGRLQEDEVKLLCPFLEIDAPSRHCRIYPARPLICRAFGTTAAPCGEVEPAHMEEESFNRAYSLLYYGDTHNFIALQLSPEWALFQAPFALWCLADGGEEPRAFLCSLLERKKESYRAVLYDLQENRFFTFLRGKKETVDGKGGCLLDARDA